MKKRLPLLYFVVFGALLACQQKPLPTTQATQTNTTTAVPTDSVPAPTTTDKAFIVLDFYETGLDTVYLVRNEGWCSIIWQNQAIDSVYTFNDTPHGIMTPIDAIAFKHTYLLNAYMGDGCPVMYKILHFKEDKSYYSSEYFGNCMDIFQMNMTENQITFEFEGDTETKRKKVKYVYQTDKLIEK